MNVAPLRPARPHRPGLGGRDELFSKIWRQHGAGPEVARDVGQAMAKNPVPLIMPCHRVLEAGNKLGGFSAPGGSATQQRMLEMEGVRLDPLPLAQETLGL